MVGYALDHLIPIRTCCKASNRPHRVEPEVIGKWQTTDLSVPYINFGPSIEGFWAPERLSTREHSARGLTAWMHRDAAVLFDPLVDLVICLRFGGLRLPNGVLTRLLTVRTEWSRK